ncbi:MAG: phytoene desaturase [Chitinophagaceae bacterium]|nr:phytoene desaturase [Chitinophagaceae bacterium]
MKKEAIIIGSGFAGLSAASFLAKAGWDVTVLEKHNQPGGRARRFKAVGFTFDMGPSWYWMPDVFERYFKQFGRSVSDFYELVRLDPSYRIYWKDGPMDVPADYLTFRNLFESIESGAGDKLDHFIGEAAYKYQLGINKLIYKSGQSLIEFLDMDLISGLFRLDVFNSIKTNVARHFSNPKLKEIMEFPVLFLGALPEDTPALYSLMNYADIKGGTWYPEKGMYQIVEAMYLLAVELGVKFKFEEEVIALDIENKSIKTITTSVKEDGITIKKKYQTEVVVAGADYHHVEMDLLPKAYRSYSEKYWETRMMAPGCLIYYVGLNKKLSGIEHHTLFFDTSFKVHGEEIYKTKQWPTNPLFYVSVASVTDPESAPEGGENLFLLIPVAAGLKGDDEALRDSYFDMIVARMEKQLGQSIKDSIVYKKTFAHREFISEYHSFKGNAYGLANTLLQTAFLKPACRSKKVKNLFYTGQLTVPGPGVPPSLISGEIVAGEVIKAFRQNG